MKSVYCLIHAKEIQGLRGKVRYWNVSARRRELILCSQLVNRIQNIRCVFSIKSAKKRHQSYSYLRQWYTPLTMQTYMISYHLSAPQRQYIHHRSINVCYPVILGKHTFQQRNSNISRWDAFVNIETMDNNLSFHINKQLLPIKIFHWYFQFLWNRGKW